MIKKQVFFVIIFSLFLVGCAENGKKLVVHENVDEELAKDTVKALDILEKKIEKNLKLDFDESDAEFLNEYITTYGPQMADKVFSTDEYQVYLHTSTLILSFGPKALVDDEGIYINGTSNFNWQMENILDIIENGFVPNE